MIEILSFEYFYQPTISIALSLLNLATRFYELSTILFGSMLSSPTVEAKIKAEAVQRPCMSQVPMSPRDSDATLPESELTLSSHYISPNTNHFTCLFIGLIEVPVNTAA